jgi:hypothetical protein
MDMTADRAESTRLDLISLRSVFDAACDELGIGMHSLDVALRERLVQCILKLARQGESNPEALQKRAVIYVRNTEECRARPAVELIAQVG